MFCAGVGKKSRFTVASTRNTEFILALLFIYLLLYYLLYYLSSSYYPYFIFMLSLFIFMYMHNNHCHRVTTHLQIIIIIIIIIIMKAFVIIITCMSFSLRTTVNLLLPTPVYLSQKRHRSSSYITLKDWFL
jgi:hypothetical protein